MALIIPITNDPNQELRVTLGDTEFYMIIKYNVRAELWTLNILDAGKDPIVEGIACRVDYSLLSRYKDIRLPENKLFLIDTSGEGLDPTLDDMGQRVLLAYDG